MKTNSTIGQSINRVDAFDKVIGTAIYPGDRIQKDELWMKVLFARRPHARILSIDTSHAEALPGVHLVLTAKDVPVNEYGLQIPDQPVLCGPSSAKEGSDRVRFVGDNIALVVAESEKIAAAAREFIQVKYEDLPILGSATEALQDDAIQLHHHAPNNIAAQQKIRRGNVDQAWNECDAIVEGLYQTPHQEHAYLQPEAGTAFIDEEERITVRCAGQWTWEDQQQIAHALNLPPEQIRVIYDAIGGAFGGREDMSVQIVLALAVMKLNERGIRRPVKIIWSREESIIGHCKRHPMTIKSKWGAKSDGTLVAAEIEIISDGGAYMYTSNKVLGNAVLCAPGSYEIPHVKLDAYAVYTNNLVSSAFRGFGGPQGHFAAEMQMNKLADKLGLDPVEMRLKNILTSESMTAVGTTIPGGVSLTEVIQKAKVEAKAKEEGHPTVRDNMKIERTETSPNASLPQPQPNNLVADKVPSTPSTSASSSASSGHGFAVGYKNIGFSFGYQENSWAEVELRGANEIEKVIVRFAGADVGQGHHTAMMQIAAESLGVSFERIKAEVSDTAFTQSSGSASASRLTMLGGNAVKKAAEMALHKWHDEERPAIADATWLAPKTSPLDPETGFGTPNFAYGYVAQAIDVTVNTETGFITIDRVVCANDVGKAINPDQVIGQIEGCIIQAHGYTILEDLHVENGYVRTPNFSTYLIPGVYDIPLQVDSVIVEDPHPDGPYGVRGMAEMPYLPYAAAVAAAVHDATSVWFDEFPLTPERVLKGLEKIQ
ncbi:xanthine dehydrogenase family protein molybdopterin-binding subunit [Chloroflexi bacterium TSY]|nr:xanthine dehydrogenase family protein molybdopterin-binding subunit [Chloroflexi bacterium TSY]